MFMHEKGYKSVYVPEVLAEGLATEDLVTYSKQQFRWARGALDVIFRYNPMFRSGLSLAQKIQYFASASFYLSGPVVLFDMVLPLVFFFNGAVPVHVSGMLLAAVFLPYMFLTLYCIQRSSNFTFTFQSLGFSMGSWNIHLQALYAAIIGKRSVFQITQKTKTEAAPHALKLVAWHCIYIAIAAGGVVFAILREGFSASLINNMAWVMLNTVVFIPFIKAALPKRLVAKSKEPEPLVRPHIRQYGKIGNN
jgi:cellulose synthase (UDP-forming)